ncbi:LigA [Burkholderia ambifaria MEX-5]|uniref:LigA n=1 Tax=Burkholderia ambifaria MEX-5 TaxID=396597 RepID=B1SZ80_9BURK|nr:LigA [Burkholderia ambifaria MEX-5]
MRLLHARHADGRGGGDRCRRGKRSRQCAGRHRRRAVPLHRLPEDRRRGNRGGMWHSRAMRHTSSVRRAVRRRTADAPRRPGKGRWQPAFRRRRLSGRQPVPARGPQSASSRAFRVRRPRRIRARPSGRAPRPHPRRCARHESARCRDTVRGSASPSGDGDAPPSRGSGAGGRRARRHCGARPGPFSGELGTADAGARDRRRRTGRQSAAARRSSRQRTDRGARVPRRPGTRDATRPSRRECNVRIQFRRARVPRARGRLGATRGRHHRDPFVHAGAASASHRSRPHSCGRAGAGARRGDRGRRRFRRQARHDGPAAARDRGLASRQARRDGVVARGIDGHVDQAPSRPNDVQHGRRCRGPAPCGDVRRRLQYRRVRVLGHGRRQPGPGACRRPVRHSPLCGAGPCDSYARDGRGRIPGLWRAANDDVPGTAHRRAGVHGRHRSARIPRDERAAAGGHPADRAGAGRQRGARRMPRCAATGVA